MEERSELEYVQMEKQEIRNRPPRRYWKQGSYKRMPREELHFLYRKLNLTIKDIAKYYQTGYYTAYKRVHDKGVPVKNGRPTNFICPLKFIYLYSVKGYGIRILEAIFNVNNTAVINRIKEWKLKKGVKTDNDWKIYMKKDLS